MVFASLLPLGVLQLWESVNEGYYEARTLGYIAQPGNAVLEWLRLPGDVVFILGGILPFVWLAWMGVRHGLKATVTRMEPETLFVEEHEQAREDRTGLVDVTATRSDSPDKSRYASDRRNHGDENLDP
jgi:nitric oxide reductase subunit B